MSEDKITLLDKHTINQIAAGEVVERPASVIKELVENSIDANANRIEIEIASGGIELMRVTDDGEGMSSRDATFAIQRHATSKIKSIDDINHVTTLGFRGEALPTIASVSKFTLTTRTREQDLGTRIYLEGNQLPKIQEVGCKVGTTIQVNALFFNTPARKKFLKTTRTEANKINECIIKQALANPKISFRFIQNNRQTLATSGNDDLKETIENIYGTEIGKSLLKVDLSPENFPEKAHGMKIFGYISKPSVTRSVRNWQTFIVNHRVIENYSIAKAIDDAYQTLVPKFGYPLAVLFFDIPESVQQIDVNVHPRKTEIKFEDEGAIFKAVFAAVCQALRGDEKSNEAASSQEKPAMNFHQVAKSFDPNEHQVAFQRQQENLQRNLNFTIDYETGEKIYHKPTAPAQEKYEKPSHDLLEEFRETQKILNSSIIKKESDPTTELIEEAQPREQTAQEKISQQTQQTQSNQQTQLKSVGQVALCYLLAIHDDTLYIVDQHSAHERILYDKFSRQANEGIPSQQLLIHSIFNFSEAEMELITQQQDLFFHLGFDLDPCGENQCRLKSIPVDIPESQAEETIREILGELFRTDGQENENTTAARIRHACLAITACHAAIRRGEPLSEKQQQNLLEELSQTERPYTCPHGRPTMIQFDAAMLAKLFKRT